MRRRRAATDIPPQEPDVTLDTLARLATALGVDVMELVRQPPEPGSDEADIPETRIVTTEQSLRNRLATNVRALRMKQGLTLEDAAKRAEMPWQDWEKIEAGLVNATVQMLVQLAVALNVNTLELLRPI